MTEPAGHLIETVDDGIATLTMNRPAALNALSPAMSAGLEEAIPRLARDPRELPLAPSSRVWRSRDRRRRLLSLIFHGRDPSPDRSHSKQAFGVVSGQPIPRPVAGSREKQT